MANGHGDGRNGNGNSFRTWLQMWVAPPTLIAAVAFAGMTGVAHYRLSEVEREISQVREKEIQSIRTRIDLEAREERESYAERRVLIVKLDEATLAVRTLSDRLQRLERMFEAQRGIR